MTRFHAAAAIGLLLASSPALSQMPMGPDPTVAQRQAMPYLEMAGQGDVFEITSSQIAIMRSRNPAVRRFATMLIDHHSRTTNLTLAAAKAGGVMPPPPALDAQHRAMIGQLLSAPAAEFDRTYLMQQVPAHQTALTLQTGYSANGDVATLRGTAKDAVPIIRRHLEQAQALHGM